MCDRHKRPICSVPPTNTVEMAAKKSSVSPCDDHHEHEDQRASGQRPTAQTVRPYGGCRRVRAPSSPRRRWRWTRVEPTASIEAQSPALGTVPIQPTNRERSYQYVFSSQRWWTELHLRTRARSSLTIGTARSGCRGTMTVSTGTSSRCVSCTWVSTISVSSPSCVLTATHAGLSLTARWSCMTRESSTCVVGFVATSVCQKRRR